MNPKKIIKSKSRCYLCIAIIAMSLFIIWFAVNNRKNVSLFANLSRPTLCYQEQCVYVQVADTPKTREKWLMYRRYMWDNKWMLFVFQESGIYAFWMKNTLMPLDIIRLDEDYNIVYIKDSAPTCSEDPCPRFMPTDKASYVLELNAWKATELWLKVWDKLTYTE